jgi:hypothetical protein
MLASRLLSKKPKRCIGGSLRLSDSLDESFRRLGLADYLTPQVLQSAATGFAWSAAMNGA